jgi:hypothetical protein
MNVQIKQIVDNAQIVREVAHLMYPTPRNHASKSDVDILPGRAMGGAAPHLLDRAFVDLGVDVPTTLVPAERIKYSREPDLIGLDMKTESGTEFGANELLYGDTCYPLRKAAKVIFAEQSYSIEGISTYIKGHGATEAAARKHFLDLFHEQFQLIGRTWPSFRTEQQKEMWHGFEAFVDLERYASQKVIVFPHEVGRLLDAKLEGNRLVRWHEEHDEEVPLTLAPGDFAAFRTDDWFEAVVQRRKSGELVKILYASTLSRPPVYSKKEREEFWNQKHAS